ncbi:MAG: EamA family transporter [Clostridia bacterium]|nr:EamA family transporter [Clostridia bacterium]
MILLLLAILSSSMISIIMRISSDKISANLSMLTVNYLICSFLGAVYASFDILPVKTLGFNVTLLLGLLSGLLYLISFMLLQLNTRKNGIVLSSIFMKLGLLVPMVISVLFFREIPTIIQIAGFIIAIGAIILINIKKESNVKNFGVGLILLLLMGGSADAMSKVFERLGTATLSNQYLFYTFASAFILCLVLAIIKKEHPGKRELFFGFLIGIPNFFSSKFLLGALGTLPAVVVYPTFCVATMLVVSLTGAFIFKEKLTKLQWFALILIILSLAMLNI